MKIRLLCGCALLFLLPAIGLAQVKIKGTVQELKEENRTESLRADHSDKVIVSLYEGTDKFIALKKVAINGTYEFNGLEKPTGTGTQKYLILAKYNALKDSAEVEIKSDSPNEITADLNLQRPSIVEFSRAIVGFEQSGASSAESKQKYFFDLHIEIPFHRKSTYDSDLGARFRLWSTTRISSVPQQIQSAVGDFIVKFPQEAAKVKVNEVAQAAEVLGGIEMRLAPWGVRYATPRGNHDMLSMSIIAGGGAITPFNPRDSLEVFEVSDEARSKLQLAADKKFVAFVLPDRDRFFRQYFAGLSFKTRYFKNGLDTGRYAAQFDITYGINEAVTGGRQSGGVFRLEGFYALPVRQRFISLFGTVLFRPVRASIGDPLILSPAPAGTKVPASDVVIIPVKQLNRDYYRIGAGLDLVGLIDLFKNGNK